MKLYWLPWSLFTWALFLACAIPLWLAGWVVVPIAAWRKAYRLYPSRLWPYPVLNWSWSWVRAVYGNEEDGIDGARGYQRWSDDTFQNEWWLARTRNGSLASRIIRWSANRNPMGNLRFLKPFGFDPNGPDYTTHYVGTTLSPGNPGWYWARKGLYTGFYAGVGRWRFRIGWNIYAQDRFYAVTDYRAKGCGFKLQLKRGPA